MSNEPASSQLNEFISASKQHGASDEFLAALLVRRGWPADEVYAALADYLARLTGGPVPQGRSSSQSARDAFFYLLSFVTLAIWAGALGAVLFQFADFAIPDALSGRYSSDFRSAIAWNLASLGVAFPIYLLAMRLIFSEARKSPERLQSGVRKWLTYLALLITASAVIGDLICFLGYFLLGELTARFLIKELIVLVICGGIFGYYLSSLRWDRDTGLSLQRTRNRFYAAIAAVAVAGTFITGIAIAGMPSEQRQREADRRRVSNLRSIASAVHDRYSRREVSTLPALPPTLEALKAERFVDRITDPETGAGYIYRPGDGTAYNLCATFAYPDAAESTRWNATSPFWRHPAGESCFSLDASQSPPN